MSAEEDDLERRFKEDLDKAIALSLQTNEYEKIRNETRKQSFSQVDRVDTSVTRSTTITLAPRPRPGAKAITPSPNNSTNQPPIYSQVNKHLPPPPQPRKQSITTPANADLISFTSPTKNESTELKSLNTPSNRHAIYPDLQFLLQNNTNNHASNNNPTTSNPFGFNQLTIDCTKTESKLPFPNVYPQLPAPDIGFKRSVMPRTSPFPQTVPALTNSPWGENSALDVFKIVSKRDNNNLIDLSPRLPSMDSHSVLEVFDPFAPQKPVAVETPLAVDTYDTQMKGSEGSIYDTYDPFDYMTSPTSLDGSQGDPIYSAGDESVSPRAKIENGDRRSAYGFTLPSGDVDQRTAEWIRSGLVFDPKRIVRPIGLLPEGPEYKNNKGLLVEKVDVRRGSAQLEAFCSMVNKLRAQFLASDRCSNSGLVHAATVDCTYSEGTAVKLVVTCTFSPQSITFTSNLSSSIDHVISHVVVMLEGHLPSNSASDYVLKIEGMSEYLVSETVLGDYEYLHQCIKLDEDVALNLVYSGDLKRPLGRMPQDDINDLPILPQHLVPNEPLQPITYETMIILLETLEKEMVRVVDAAREMSSADKLPRFQPNGVIQAVKAICSVLGEIETVDITEALENFKTEFNNFMRRSDVTITADHGPYSTVVVNSPLEDSMLSHCEKISGAVMTLIEAYCKAFIVDFKLVEATPRNSIESRSILEIMDPVLVLLCEVNRLDPEWKFAAYMVEVQLYHGTRPVQAPRRSEPCPISQSFYPRIAFNEWITLYESPICSLPKESRLVFILFGLTLLAPDHELSKHNPGVANYSKVELGWSAIQCFDHEGRLSQGSFLLSMWPVMADKRMGPAPEPGTHPVGGHPVVRVFLPQYSAAVLFPPLPDVSHTPTKHDFSSLDQHTQDALMSFSLLDTFTRIDPNDREVLWDRRHYMHGIPQALPKVLLAASRWDYASLSDLHAMVYSWKQMEPLAALQLLLPCFPDAVVRSLAVTWLRDLSNDELADYLPQLVQALKNETYENNPLARFLLERSLISPRVAHHLFWLLVQNLPGDLPQNSAESVSGETVEVISYRHHRRLRILLRALWAIAGEAMRQRFTSQQCLVKNLYDIAQHLKSQKDGLRLKTLHDELRSLNNDLEISSSGLPLSASATIAGVDVENCGYFPTKTLPLKLRFYSDEGKIVPAIFKVGDPLQQDMLTLQMIRIMDKMWLKEGLDLKIVTFGCVPTGYQRGMIELVKDADTLKNIQTQNGLTGCFKDRPIAEWLEKHNPGQLEYESAVRNFTASCAGYTVATYILGICDRHNDNIMLKKSGHLFHIDFGKFLGDAQMFLNFKRDRVPFVLTSDMAYVINGGDRPSQRFQHFVDLCCNAFSIIRKNSGIILNLLGFMVNAGIPGVTMDSMRYVQLALLPGKSKPEASAMFAKMIDTALKAWFTQFNFFIHSLAQMRSDKDRYSGDFFSFAPKKHTCEEDGRITGVEVCKAQKRYGSEKYYVYIIRVERSNQPDSFIFRTYAELCELHQKLCTIFPLANLHSLPDGIHIGRSNIKMVAERRMLDVKEFLVSLFSMADEVAHSDIVYTFFHPLLRDQEEVNFNADKLRERTQDYTIRSNLTGQVLLSLQYQTGIFTVMVHHVRDLSRLTNGQKPSTYVKTYLIPDPDKSTKRKTKVVKRNCNPSFMENLVYRMSFDVVRRRTLEVTVWNYDPIQENEFLGSFQYPLESFTQNQEIVEWFPLGSDKR